MALSLALTDVVRATLPQGHGHVGFIGLAPDGEAYHLLTPVDLEQAQVLCAAAGSGGEPAPPELELRPGWRYLPCRTYQPPPSPCAAGRPGPGAFAQARRTQALLTAGLIAAWARRQGWWVNIE